MGVDKGRNDDPPADGWDDAAVPDDVTDIAQLLNMGIEPTRHLLEELD